MLLFASQAQIANKGDVMFCSECGMQVEDNAKFCTECGAVQTEVDNSLQRPAMKKSTPVSNGNKVALNMATVAVNSKSVGMAFILILFFGPFGMLYSTIIGGVVMLMLPIPIVIIMFTSAISGNLDGIAFGLIFFIFYWVICLVWGVTAVNSYNKNLLKQLQTTS